MLHLRNAHAGEVIDCIFDNCTKKFNNNNSLRSHFTLKHIKLNQCDLKSVNKIDNIRLEVSSDQSSTIEDLDDIEVEETVIEGKEDDEAEINIAEEEDNSFEDEDEQFFLMSYADFLNQLNNFHSIPNSIVQIIGEQYLKNYLQANHSKTASLRKSLEKNENNSEPEILRVINDFQSQDLFLSAQNKLDTEYKRTKVLKQNFNYVAPLEIILNEKEVKENKATKSVMHYIPIIESIRNLVEDPTFNYVLEKNVTENGSTLGDVKDGELFKKNAYFRKHPEALTLMLYSDAIEVVNPLGAGRGKHKVIQIFFTLCEIPKHQRSKIDRIQLVAVFKEKLIKQFGYQKIYHRLVEDLKILETGITVHQPVERVVKAGLLIHPADNLEAHGVGGYSMSFSSKDV